MDRLDGDLRLQFRLRPYRHRRVRLRQEPLGTTGEWETLPRVREEERTYRGVWNV